MTRCEMTELRNCQEEKKKKATSKTACDAQGQKSCLSSKLKLFILRRLSSFQRGTVGLCKSTGCKVTSCHIWRFEKNSATRPTSNHTSAAQVRFPDDRIILQLWKRVTLQPVDLQRPTIPLWKELNLLNKHNFN